MSQAPNRVGITLIVLGLAVLGLSVFVIHINADWQRGWVYFAIFTFFFTSVACAHSVLRRILDRMFLLQIWALTYSDRAKFFFITYNMGRVLVTNPSAQCHQCEQVGQTLQSVLKLLLGNPHASISRLKRDPMVRIFGLSTDHVDGIDTNFPSNPLAGARF